MVKQNLHLKFTEQEIEQIKAAAAAAEFISVTQFVRSVLLKHINNSK